jgi:hypothetical protein
VCSQRWWRCGAHHRRAATKSQTAEAELELTPSGLCYQRASAAPLAAVLRSDAVIFAARA